MSPKVIKRPALKCWAAKPKQAAKAKGGVGTADSGTGPAVQEKVKDEPGPAASSKAPTGVTDQDDQADKDQGSAAGKGSTVVIKGITLGDNRSKEVAAP